MAAALVRLLLLLVLAPAALLLAGPAMLPAAAGRPGPKLLVEVEVAVGGGDVPVVVGERDPVPVKHTGGYTLSRAPRKPPSGPSPIHNDVGPAGFVVRRITAESSAAGGGGLEARVEGKAAAADPEEVQKDEGLPSSESQVLGRARAQDRHLPASISASSQ